MKIREKGGLSTSTRLEIEPVSILCWLLTAILKALKAAAVTRTASWEMSSSAFWFAPVLRSDSYAEEGRVRGQVILDNRISKMEKFHPCILTKRIQIEFR